MNIKFQYRSANKEERKTNNNKYDALKITNFFLASIEIK